MEGIHVAHDRGCLFEESGINYLWSAYVRGYIDNRTQNSAEFDAR